MPFINPRILSVSELTASIRGLLETEFPFVAVTGEISNLRKPYSGHLYFTLKDENAQIKAVLFKNQQRYLESLPADGLHALCRGRMSLYEPRGEYQIIVDSIEAIGKGSLQEAFEATKKRLLQEGLFEQAKKKALPFLPENIALITSPQGAAVHDFLHVAARRFPSIPITIYPVTVQGDGAGQEIIQALASIIAENSADVIALCRGGGSLEDLWAFNNEHLARAIAACRIPVVTGIGHETDFTIADFVADLRAPTPTAAAERIIPDRKHLLASLKATQERMAQSVNSNLAAMDKTIGLYRRILRNPEQLLDHTLLQVDHLQSRLLTTFVNRLQKKTNRFNQLTAFLFPHHPEKKLTVYLETTEKCRNHAVAAIARQLKGKEDHLIRSARLLSACGPDNILARGYAIVSTEENHAAPGRIISDSKQVRPEDKLLVRVHRGRIHCRVTTTETK